VLLGLLSGCSLLRPHFTRPTVTVVNIEMRHGNFLQQAFAVKLNVDNPNDRPLPVKALHVELKVDGELIASGDSDRAFVVPAEGSAPFDMTITANLALAVLKLNSKLNQHAEGIDYELSGNALTSLAFMSNLPFHQSGNFSLKGN
jgi:LEA14-like dessication related protein